MPQTVREFQPAASAEQPARPAGKNVTESDTIAPRTEEGESASELS